MRNKLLPFDKEPLSCDAYERIAKSAREKAGIDERAVNEMNKTPSKRIIGRRIFIGIAAAALMCSTAAGAYAVGSRTDMFKEYIKGDTTSFDAELEETVKSGSDDDIILSIDGIVCDELCCRMLVTVESKTDTGKAVIKDLETYQKDIYPSGDQLKIMEKNGDDELSGDLTLFTYYYDDKNTDTEFHQMFELNINNLDTSDTYILLEQETGLSVEFNIPSFLEPVRMYPEEELPGAFHYVSLSELGLHIRMTTEDTADLAFYKMLSWGPEDSEIYLNYSDGTSLQLDHISGSYGDGQELTEFGDVTFTGNKVDATVMVDGCPSFIDIENVVGVTIDGVEYKLSE